MPFFESDKLEVDIALDDSPFFLGGSIGGTVRITTIERCRVRGIILKYKINEGLRTVDNDEFLSFEPDQSFYKVEYFLFGARDCEPTEIEVGSYTYPFVIPIPQNVPPSYLVPQCVGTIRDCACCCDSFAVQRIAYIATHRLQLRVIIPYSMRDKMTNFVVEPVLQPMDSESFFRCRPVTVGQVAKSMNCVECFPSLACCTGSQHAEIELTVPRPSLVLVDGASLPFYVRGRSDVPYCVCLVRRIQLLVGGRRHTKGECEVVEFKELPPLTLDEDEARGDLLLTNVCNLTPSFQGVKLKVEYFVELRLNYTKGCYQGVPDGKRGRIAIQVANVIHEIVRRRRQMPAPPTAQAPVPETMGEATPRESEGNAVVARPNGFGAYYAYTAPPPHAADHFHPVAPVREPGYAEAVWGVVIDPTSVAAPFRHGGGSLQGYQPSSGHPSGRAAQEPSAAGQVNEVEVHVSPEGEGDE